ncbi:Prostate stem cell antigen, partial [Merops nubicus]
GSSLKCYSCSSQLSNANCQKAVECTEKELCKTDVIRIVGLFNIINKGCDASCVSSYQDFNVGNRNVSCCSTNLCNVNSAGSVRGSYGVAAGVAGTVLWTFLHNK